MCSDYKEGCCRYVTVTACTNKLDYACTIEVVCCKADAVARGTEHRDGQAWQTYVEPADLSYKCKLDPNDVKREASTSSRECVLGTAGLVAYSMSSTLPYEIQ